MKSRVVSTLKYHEITPKPTTSAMYIHPTDPPARDHAMLSLLMATEDHRRLHAVRRLLGSAHISLHKSVVALQLMSPRVPVKFDFAPRILGIVLWSSNRVGRVRVLRALPRI